MAMNDNDKYIFTKLFTRFCKEHGLLKKFCKNKKIIDYWAKYGQFRHALAPFNTFSWRNTSEGYEFWYTRCLLFCDFVIDYAIENKGVISLSELEIGGRYLITTFDTHNLYGPYRTIYDRLRRKVDKVMELNRKEMTS